MRTENLCISASIRNFPEGMILHSEALLPWFPYRFAEAMIADIETKVKVSLQRLERKHMKTVYAACLSRVGLSHVEAAALHGVRLDTVKSWSSGRNRIPESIWHDLREYEKQIMLEAEQFKESGCSDDKVAFENLCDKINLMTLAIRKLTQN